MSIGRSWAGVKFSAGDPGWDPGDVLTDPSGRQWVIQHVTVGQSDVIRCEVDKQNPANVLVHRVRVPMTKLQLVELNADTDWGTSTIDAASRVMDDDPPEKIALGTGFARQLEHAKREGEDS